MTTVNELIKRLRNTYKPDDVIVAHIWQPEDVIMRADERGIEITQEEAEDAILDIEHHLDCELGITWITIDCAIDNILEGREEVKDGTDI